MTTIKQLLATAALVGFTAIPASAATTIYSETFSSPFETSGTSPLNGTTPNITVSTNTWVASDWRENGTAPTSTSFSDDDSAFLAFVPTSNTIYTLSATLTLPTGGAITGGATTGWVGIGFTEGNTTTGSFFDNSTAPWMLWRPSNASAASEVRTFLGTGTTGGDGEGPFTGTATFDIVLNTQAPTWTAEWFVNGVSVRPAEAVATQAITHIGLGRENGSISTFTNFSLTQIPEPSTTLLGGLGLLALLRRRRN